MVISSSAISGSWWSRPPDEAALDRATEAVTEAGARCRMELRPVDGQHAAAVVAALPIGRKPIRALPEMREPHICSARNPMRNTFRWPYHRDTTHDVGVLFPWQTSANLGIRGPCLGVDWGSDSCGVTTLSSSTPEVC